MSIQWFAFKYSSGGIDLTPYGFLSPVYKFKVGENSSISEELRFKLAIYKAVKELCLKRRISNDKYRFSYVCGWENDDFINNLISFKIKAVPK